MKTTDLEQIKKVCKILLSMPVSEAEKDEFILSHPYFETRYVPYKTDDGLELVDVFEDGNYERLIEQWSGQIDKTNSIELLFTMIRKPYMLALFSLTNQYMSEEDYGMILNYVWCESENPNGDVNVPIGESAEFFKKANKKYLMEECDYEHYISLPSSFTVYRGVAKGRVKDGLSWTENLDKAKWFANRFDSKGHIQKGTINKEDVLAYFNTRNEDEIVVDPDKVKNKEIIEV